MFSITHSDNTVDGVTLHSAGWILQPASPDKVGDQSDRSIFVSDQSDRNIYTFLTNQIAVFTFLTNQIAVFTFLTNQEFPPPELFSHCLVSGHKLYGMIYKPHNAVPGVR